MGRLEADFFAMDADFFAPSTKFVSHCVHISAHFSLSTTSSRWKVYSRSNTGKRQQMPPAEYRTEMSEKLTNIA